MLIANKGAVRTHYPEELKRILRVELAERSRNLLADWAPDATPR